MEKYIYIIVSVSSLNGMEPRYDNVYAVTSEEEAIKDVERLNQQKKKEENPNDFECWYIYERIRLFD